MNPKEEEKKQSLINEKIMEKGYNPEDLSNFITRTKGVQYEQITCEQLNVIIDEFKTEKLQLSSTYIPSKKKNIKDMNDVILYKDYAETIICQKQKESILSAYETLTIVVSDPEKGETGLFGGSKHWTYLIATNEINSSTRRSFPDFEWLRTKLSEEYPITLIPPLVDNHSLFDKLDPSLLEVRVRYLNKFLYELSNKKLLKQSDLFYKFLSLPTEEFNKFKGESNTTKKIKEMEEIINSKGELILTLNKEIINKARNIKKAIEPNVTLYQKLNVSFQNLLRDYMTMSNRLKEISDIFFHIEEEAKKGDQSNTVQKVMRILGNLFKCYSSSYINQKDMINNEYKEYFEYMGLELGQFIPLIKDFKEKKHNYKLTELKLNNKKEILFNGKKFQKWDIIATKDEIIDYSALEKDKAVAFKKMLTKETFDSAFYKYQLAYSTGILVNNYNRLIKQHEERIKKHFEGLKSRNKDLVADAHNLKGLLNFKL